MHHHLHVFDDFPTFAASRGDEVLIRQPLVPDPETAAVTIWRAVAARDGEPVHLPDMGSLRRDAAAFLVSTADLRHLEPRLREPLGYPLWVVQDAQKRARRSSPPLPTLAAAMRRLRAAGVPFLNAAHRLYAHPKARVRPATAYAIAHLAEPGRSVEIEGVGLRPLPPLSLPLVVRWFWADLHFGRFRSCELARFLGITPAAVSHYTAAYRHAWYARARLAAPGTPPMRIERAQLARMLVRAGVPHRHALRATLWWPDDGAPPLTRAERRMLLLGVE